VQPKRPVEKVNGRQSRYQGRPSRQQVAEPAAVAEGAVDEGDRRSTVGRFLRREIVGTLLHVTRQLDWRRLAIERRGGKHDRAGKSAEQTLQKVAACHLVHGALVFATIGWDAVIVSYPDAGAMVYTWVAPWSSVVIPDGETDPLLPALAVTVYLLIAKVAEIV